MVVRFRPCLRPEDIQDDRAQAGDKHEELEPAAFACVVQASGTNCIEGDEQNYPDDAGGNDGECGAVQKAVRREGEQDLNDEKDDGAEEEEPPELRAPGSSLEVGEV